MRRIGLNNMIKCTECNEDVGLPLDKEDIRDADEGDEFLCPECAKKRRG